MTAIVWDAPTMSGEAFETVVAVLLLQEHDHAVRIRIHQGDGGVDILAPDGSGGWIVYQCKHFTGRMRWDQVERSLGKLAGGSFLGRRISEWHLVVPQDPTRTKFKTFLDKTKSVPFDCVWDGLSKLDSWAAAVGFHNRDIVEFHCCKRPQSLEDGDLRLPAE